MTAMEQKNILLVEDDPDDEKLIMHVFKKNNMINEVLVAHDGIEALDYLFGTGNTQIGIRQMYRRLFSWI